MLHDLIYQEPVLTVAVIIAIVAFFKKQLGLKGWKVALAAFIVALVLGLLPVMSTTFPLAAPWISAISNVILLFLSAAGTVDFVTTISRPK